MRKCVLLAAAIFVAIASRGHAQGLLGDVLTGKLVNPEVGQWAWYELTDAKGKHAYYLRQAVVGEEKVGRKNAHWVEIELVPEIGLATIYKLLLSGPASGVKNIHRVLLKQGGENTTELPVDEALAAGPPGKQDREVVGNETVETQTGDLEAEHVRLSGEGPVVEMWLNDTVRPMGVVKLATENGQLILREFGTGGENGASRLDAAAAPAQRSTTVKVEEGAVVDRAQAKARENFRGRVDKDNKP